MKLDKFFKNYGNYICISIFILIIYYLCNNNGTIFENYGQSNNKYKMVLCYASWCPHCKDIIPEWDSFSKNFNAKGISIEKIDCAKEENNWFSKKYEISGQHILNTIDTIDSFKNVVDSLSKRINFIDNSK